MNLKQKIVSSLNQKVQEWCLQGQLYREFQIFNTLSSPPCHVFVCLFSLHDGLFTFCYSFLHVAREDGHLKQQFHTILVWQPVERKQHSSLQLYMNPRQDSPWPCLQNMLLFLFSVSRGMEYWDWPLLKHNWYLIRNIEWRKYFPRNQRMGGG